MPALVSSAGTVVSSWANASVVDLIARVVSFARAPIRSCRSENVPTGHHRVGAQPDPLAPNEQHRGPERWGVVGVVLPSAVAHGDHPARSAASQDLVGLAR